MMDSGNTIDLFGNPKNDYKQTKPEIPMKFLTNAGSKIVGKVGIIPGAGQT